jgi:hypothetical protein
VKEVDVPKDNKTIIKARNAKLIKGIQKNLSGFTEITLGGTVFTIPNLVGAIQADSDAIDTADAAHKQLEQAVTDEKNTHVKTADLVLLLRNFVISYFGKKAIAILGDFGFSVPKKAVKKVKVKVAAVEKAKATRDARHTMGKKQRAEIKGTTATSSTGTSQPVETTKGGAADPKDGTATKSTAPMNGGSTPGGTPA